MELNELREELKKCRDESELLTSKQTQYEDSVQVQLSQSMEESKNFNEPYKESSARSQSPPHTRLRLERKERDLLVTYIILQLNITEVPPSIH